MTAAVVTNAGAWYALGAGCFLAIAAVLWARHQDGAPLPLRLPTRPPQEHATMKAESIYIINPDGSTTFLGTGMVHLDENFEMVESEPLWVDTSWSTELKLSKFHSWHWLRMFGFTRTMALLAPQRRRAVEWRRPSSARLAVADARRARRKVPPAR